MRKFSAVILESPVSEAIEHIRRKPGKDFLSILSIKCRNWFYWADRADRADRAEIKESPVFMRI